MDKADRIGPACSPRAEFPGPGHSFVPPKQALRGAGGSTTTQCWIRGAAKRLLGARVGPEVDRRKPISVNVRVTLSGPQRRMPENLLHAAQVRSPLEKMGRGSVPESMRSQIRHTRSGRLTVNHRTHNPRVDTFSTFSDEKRRTRIFMCERRTPLPQPAFNRHKSNGSKRNDTLLISLADNAQRRRSPLEGSQLEPAKLRDADSRRVDRLEDRPIPQRDAPLVPRPRARMLHETLCIVPVQDLGKPLLGSGGRESESGVGGEDPPFVRPRGEGPKRSRFA